MVQIEAFEQGAVVDAAQADIPQRQCVGGRRMARHDVPQLPTLLLVPLRVRVPRRRSTHTRGHRVITVDRSEFGYLFKHTGDPRWVVEQVCHYGYHAARGEHGGRVHMEADERLANIRNYHQHLWGVHSGCITQDAWYCTAFARYYNTIEWVDCSP
eukprot:scaffold117936_cov63-Phaeocystis_antarctica.AAC.1